MAAEAVKKSGILSENYCGAFGPVTQTRRDSGSLKRPADRLVRMGARAGSRKKTKWRTSPNSVLIASAVLGYLDLDRLLDARSVKPDAGLVAMGLDDELQRIPKVLATLVQRTALADRTRDLFDPPDEPSVGFRFDDGVIALFHTLPFCPPSPDAVKVLEGRFFARQLIGLARSIVAQNTRPSR